MKKFILLLLVMFMTLSLISCSIGTGIGATMGGDIVYNGAKYHLVSEDDDFYKYYSIDIKELERYRFQETNIGKTLLGEPINIAFEKAFGDSIIRVYRSDNTIDHYFKEGFEFPSYKEIVISGVHGENFISHWNIVAEDVIMNLDFLFDFDKEITLTANDLVGIERVECYGFLSDDTFPCLELGPIYVVRINNKQYIQVGLDAGDIYYMVDDSLSFAPFPIP